MITVKNIDLFESGARIICHQVNCQGVMGSGVAKQVRNKYPHVYEKYIELCNTESDKKKLLGTVLNVSSDVLGSGNGCIGDKFPTISNLFAQEKFGYDGTCYTDYNALNRCLQKVVMMTFTKNNWSDATIAIPYLMGCHRGGGDWDEVYQMMEEVFKDCNVILCKYNGG